MAEENYQHRAKALAKAFAEERLKTKVLARALAKAKVDSLYPYKELFLQLATAINRELPINSNVNNTKELLRNDTHIRVILPGVVANQVLELNKFLRQKNQN